MSLVSSAVNSPYRGSGRRLSPGELIDHGRRYLAQCGLPTDSEDIALEVGYTLATVGPSTSLRESLTQRLAPPKPKPDPEPDPMQERKREWGRGRTARLELRLTRHERQVIAALAEKRGESVGEVVRAAATQSLGRRSRSSEDAAQPLPTVADARAKVERAQEAQEVGRTRRERAQRLLRAG